MAKNLFMLYFNPNALGAPASDDLSIFEKKEDICYSFILSKLVYHFAMVTLQKHHYMNNPTTKNTFIIAHVAILMAREGMFRKISIVLDVVIDVLFCTHKMQSNMFCFYAAIL